jgi:RNA polymerase sigma-70 factor (family 1)
LLNEKLYNEHLLVEQMQAGDEKAFTLLYRYYSPRLYLNILKIVRDNSVAEELVQELFSRIWQKKESFTIKDNFAGYLYRSGHNLVLDHFRKLASDRKLIKKFTEVAEKSYNHIEAGINSRQSSVILKEAIEKLPPQQKKVYELVRMEGCTYKKAAEIMGISSHTVKEYLMLTRKSIKKYVISNFDSSAIILVLLLQHLSGLFLFSFS